MNHTHTALLALYSSVVLLALNGLFAKLIPLDSVTITGVRSVVACFGLLVLIQLRHSSIRLPAFKTLLGIYGLGVLLGLHWITYFQSMQVSTVAIGMLTLFSYPVITVLIEPLFKRSLPQWQDVCAAFLVFVGVAIIASDGLWHSQRVNSDSSLLVGALWGLLSAVLFAVRNTLQKYCFHATNSASLIAHQVFAVSIMLLPFVDIASLGRMPFEGWTLIIVLGLVSTAAAHSFLSMSLKYLDAKSVAMISCSTPVVGGFFAWLLLGEKPPIVVYFGGALILSVAIYESLKQKTKYA
ncbi:MAG: drug/metabolite transporter (DMT)-like permease [Lentisphaeria bacterium]|jgi:drug/metabolite transporter (DMT)-like permease